MPSTTTAAQMSSSAVLDPRQMFPKEPVGTYPCSSSSSSDDSAAADHHHPLEEVEPVPRSTPPPVSTPERPCPAQEYGPSVEAVRHMQSQYNKSLQMAATGTSEHHSAHGGREVSPTTRRLTTLHVTIQPAKQIDLAGYGGMVSSLAVPMVSDGEDEDEEDYDDAEDDEESQKGEMSDDNNVDKAPLDGLIGTCLPETPSRDDGNKRTSLLSSADSSPTASAESSPSKARSEGAASSASSPATPTTTHEEDNQNTDSTNDGRNNQTTANENADNDNNDADAFLALQNKRYESMQTLGEMALPGSSKPLALPAPPPLKTIEIATEAPRPTTGKGYFNFILSAASASHEAAAANQQQHRGHHKEKPLLLCNGTDQVLQEDDASSASSARVVAPLSPASPDELMDVDDDDGSDCSGFSDLDHASTSSPVAAGDAAVTTTAVAITPASNDELMDIDDYSDDSDLDNDSVDNETTNTNTAKINITRGADSGVTWKDESKKHQVQPHQYHRTRGNIAFRAPKFFRDGPDMAAAPTPSAPAADIGGTSTKLSAITSPLSTEGTLTPSPMTLSPRRAPNGDPFASKFTFAVMSSSAAAAVNAAVVSSDIAKESGEDPVVDPDFASSLDGPSETREKKKSWKKSLGKKLRISRKKKAGATDSSSGGGSTAEVSAELEDAAAADKSPVGYAQSPTQKQSECGSNPYNELYSDDEEEDGLACPEDLEMPGIAQLAPPATTSTALVVASSSAEDEEASYKEHQKRPDLDKFRGSEAARKKMTPFSMWYDGEEDLVVNGGRGDDSVLTDDEAPADENALALVPSPNKAQSVTKMLAAFLSRNGTKCASAAAVVYDTDDDSSAGADNDDDASTGSRVGISRPTGCLYDETEDAYGGGRDGVMEQGTDHFLTNLMSGPLQGYMTGMNPDALENKDVKAIGRTVHKHTSQGADSPVRGMSRSQYDACGRHTTTYSTASLVEKGVDMVGAGGTTMKVYRLEGTGGGGGKSKNASENAAAASTTHVPSPADESHPPTREEVAKSKAGTGASSLQDSASAAQAGARPASGRPNRKTSNSILMSSLAYSALLNEDTIYDGDNDENSDDGAAPNSGALVEYNGPMRTPVNALALFGNSSERALALQGSSSTRNAGTAAPSTRAVTVASESAITVVTEGLPSNAPTNKIFVLLLQPRMRLFELVQLVYYPSVATIGDLVDLIPNNATEKLLGNQAYIGLCRPNAGGAASILTDLDLMASGAADGGSANIYRGEILVAIPEGYSGEQCQRFAKPILANSEFSKLLQRSDPLAPNTEKR